MAPKCHKAGFRTPTQSASLLYFPIGGYLGFVSRPGRSGDSPSWKVSLREGVGGGGGPRPAPAPELEEAALAPSKGAAQVVSGPPPSTLESMPPRGRRRVKPSVT